jgi:hypothetical protein
MRLKSTASCGMLGCETHGTATSRLAHAHGHEVREGEWEKFLPMSNWFMLTSALRFV